MTVSLHAVSVPVFVRGLKGLLGVLDKAAAHAETRKIDPAALLTARLYPDMFNFTRQVQLASDFAKGVVGRLAGAELPAWEDTEVSFDDLKARVQKTIDYVESFPASAIDGQEDRDISLIRRGETLVYKAAPYLLHQATPNFYFHLATAYDILRHNGVEVGKKDFIGPI